MKAAVYLRVSTKDQATANQEPACVAACKERGWTPLVMRETGSGVKDRPIWKEVRDLARDREIGALVVWSLDRMGRGLWGICDAVRELDKLGVVVVSIREPWVERGQGDEMLRDFLLRVFDWVAGFERSRLVERTKAGLDRARRNGKTLGARRKFAGEPFAFAIEQREKHGRSWGWIKAEILKRWKQKIPKATVAAGVSRYLEKQATA